jgi:hypothetical protein
MSDGAFAPIVLKKSVTTHLQPDWDIIIAPPYQAYRFISDIEPLTNQYFVLYSTEEFFNTICRKRSTRDWFAGSKW